MDDFDISAEWARDHRPARPESKDYRSAEWEDWRQKVATGYDSSLAKIEIDWSGSEEEKQYFVHCGILEISVEWDEQQEINPTMFIANRPDADEWLRKFCEKYQIPFSQPRWFLAAKYF